MIKRLVFGTMLLCCPQGRTQENPKNSTFDLLYERINQGNKLLHSVEGEWDEDSRESLFAYAKPAELFTFTIEGAKSLVIDLHNVPPRPRLVVQVFQIHGSDVPPFPDALLTSSVPMGRRRWISKSREDYEAGRPHGIGLTLEPGTYTVEARPADADVFGAFSYSISEPPFERPDAYMAPLSLSFTDLFDFPSRYYMTDAFDFPFNMR